MSFSDWSTVDAENDTSSGINIAEGCPAANVNNWGRRIMAQLRAAFNPILDAFFASTTLAQARTALGVPEGSTSMTAFGGLTNTANSVPYMTGSDAWALATLTTFGRTLIDDGDAATALTTLGAQTALTATSGGSGTSINLVISGTTYRVQFGSVTVNGTGTITFPVAFSGSPACLVSGGTTSTGSDANDRITSVSTTTATVTSSYGSSHTAYWVAIGS